ncbi:MAG: energy-coupling factor transporter ATPase [Chloroflexi bacterium]|nr:energy-coupling factor transporter ATPase [Chloroflexota bacterium]MCL5075551.1 energy-coupling factor transporter ATPase [Chloroflexota bacterium]
MYRPLITLENISFIYNHKAKNPITALTDINLRVEQGEYVSVVGANGSGKSTLAKHLNALLLPTSGDVWIKGMNTKDHSQTRLIRQTVGMVFQNPDNQLVATTVEEDIAFGPENLGIPSDEIRRGVDLALQTVGMSSFCTRAPHLLSGGEKQRVAIAGVIAMNAECLVLDEATAMLDPIGREEVLQMLHRLNGQGITIFMITHLMQEAAQAHRILVMANGRIVLDGSPRQVFPQVARLQNWQLDAPPLTNLAYRLNQRQPGFSVGILSVAEMVAEIERAAKESKQVRVWT